LRWLEYGQRLATRRRNVSASRASPDTGETLFRHALAGGAQASSTPVATLTAGARADFVVLDDASPLLAGRDASNAIDTWIFAGNANLVRSVVVAGETVVAGFRHRDEDRIAKRYSETVRKLAKSS
jgi:formimidoylglutamate deiminase